MSRCRHGGYAVWDYVWIHADDVTSLRATSHEFSRAFDECTRTVWSNGLLFTGNATQLQSLTDESRGAAIVNYAPAP